MMNEHEPHHYTSSTNSSHIDMCFVCRKGKADMIHAPQQKSDKKPYWYPVLADVDWCEYVRKDSPHLAHLTDEEIVDEVNEGAKYVTCWDNCGDAYFDYEKLADAFLQLVEHFKVEYKE